MKLFHLLIVGCISVKLIIFCCSFFLLRHSFKILVVPPVFHGSKSRTKLYWIFLSFIDSAWFSTNFSFQSKILKNLSFLAQSYKIGSNFHTTVKSYMQLIFKTIYQIFDTGNFYVLCFLYIIVGEYWNML